MHRALLLIVAGVIIAVGITLVLYVVPIGGGTQRSSIGDPRETCPRLQLDTVQCDAAIERAITLASVERSDIDRVELGRPDDDQVGIGGYLVAVVRFHMATGPTIDQEVWCIGVGVGYRGWCNDQPHQ